MLGRIQRLLHNKIGNIHGRRISQSRTRLNTEGKTTVNILNNEADLGLMINGYSQVGFRLNNEMTVLGPMVIFPRSVLSWNIGGIENITEEAFSILPVLEPSVDIVVFGVGDRQENYNFFKKLIPFSRKHNIPFEVLPTEQACSTFNFLNSEGRNVVGFMIPPKVVNFTEEDELKTKLRYQNLYETD